MVKNLLGLLCVAIMATSCLKEQKSAECPYKTNAFVAPAAEQQLLSDYLDSINISAVKHPSGFYYQIVSPGNSADSVGLCSQIQINYKGQLANDSVFDKNDNVIFVLGSLIEGWKKGIPLIRKGGEINLYIPPSLGYGNEDYKSNAGVVLIPGRSILKFNVKLLDYTVGN